MKSRLSLFISIVWLMVLAGTGAVILKIGAKCEVPSSSENRMLSAFPVLSVDTVRDGSFFDGMEGYLTDKFIQRNMVITLAGSIERYFSGTVEYREDNVTDNTAPEVKQQDAVEIEQTVTADEQTTGDSAQPGTEPAGDTVYFEHLKTVNGNDVYNKPVRKKTLDGVADLLERTAGYLKPGGTLNFIFVPQSYICNEYILNPDKYSAWSDDATSYLRTVTDNSVHVYSFADYVEEPARRGEYIVYKTDCHWTINGNWYVYNAVMRDMGITPVALSDYVMDGYAGFNGSYATNAGATGPGPDTLLLPRLMVNTHYYRYTRSFSETPRETEIYDFSVGINYYAFLGSHEGLWGTLETDAGTGRSSLVICDSYGPSFALLLTPHYDQVHLLDMRGFYGVNNSVSLREAIELWDIDDIYVVLSDINSYGKPYMESYWASFMD